MKITGQARQHGITAWANESTVMMIINALTSAGYDYHDWDITNLAEMLDDQWATVRDLLSDGLEQDAQDFLFGYDDVIDYLDSGLANSDLTPTLEGAPPIPFVLPTLDQLR